MSKFAPVPALAQFTYASSRVKLLVNQQSDDVMEMSMTNDDYSYPRYAKILHLGMAGFGIAAFLTGELAENGSASTGYLLHAYLGLSLAAFVLVNMARRHRFGAAAVFGLVSVLCPPMALGIPGHPRFASTPGAGTRYA